MDDIANKCAGLRLSNKEDNEVDLAPSMTEAGHVGWKILHKKKGEPRVGVEGAEGCMANKEELRGQ